LLLPHFLSCNRFPRFAHLCPVFNHCCQPVFWIGRIRDLAESIIPGKPRRVWLAIVAGLIYLFIFIYSFPWIESTSAHIFRAADYRLPGVLVEAAFWWWVVGSQVAFLLVIAFRTLDRAAGAMVWLLGKALQGYARPQW
jgi:hypothetical protein